MSKILIVDDDVVSVMELEEALSADNYDVAGIAYSGVAAVKMAEKLMPDLILMDIRMPGELDGISAAQAILRRQDIPIVFVTGHDDEEYLKRACLLDPAGYILKPFSQKQLIAGIVIALWKGRESSKLKTGFDNSWTMRLASYAMLTPTEIRISNLIKIGKSSKDIAAGLFIAKKTVDWHRTNIRKKLGLGETENLFSYLQKI